MYHYLLGQRFKFITKVRGEFGLICFFVLFPALLNRKSIEINGYLQKVTKPVCMCPLVEKLSSPSVNLLPDKGSPTNSHSSPSRAGKTSE